MVLRDPIATLVQGIARHLILELRVFLLKDFARHVFEDEAETRIRTIEFVDIRVQIDRQRVTDPAEVDLLVERLVVRVVGDNSPVANAGLDLKGVGRVVDALGVRDVFDMPNHPLKDVCGFLGRTTAYRTNPDRCLVLPAVVDDL